MIETETEARRIAWRCRRGHLELDLVLQHFVRAVYPDLNGGERDAFVRVLALPDSVLMQFIERRESASSEDEIDPGMRAILGRLARTTAAAP